MKISRRTVLFSGVAATLPSFAQSVALHGLSSFGELKYAAAFPHFDYVNPNAKKGGVFTYQPPSWAYNQSPETFNSFNTFILRGEAPQGLESIYASLMEGSSDEAGAAYGLVAKSVSHDALKLNYVFDMRIDATFHDGTPITAEDVAFTLETFKREGHPVLQIMLKEVAGVKALSTHKVQITLSDKRSRDLILSVAAMPILSKNYYSKRAFNETTLDVPLGSHAYRVGKFEPGRYIEYTRVQNWWGENLPTQKGKNNFDILRIDLYKDRDVAFEAFKAGQISFREEFTSKTWATGYDFPSVKDGRVKLLTLKDETPSGSQGWYFNTRRDKFKDIRVREAIMCAFDYEWVQKNIQYGLLERTTSFFQNSDMMAVGLPEGDELKLMTELGLPITPPVSPVLSDGSGQDRGNLRKSLTLFKQAGYEVKDGVMKNAKGETFTFEFLDHSRALVPHIESFSRSLKRLGIETSIRVVDPSQYQERVRNVDFDVVSRRLTMALTPGEGLKSVFGSDQADVAGSHNIAGIKDKTVDILIEKAVNASSRAELYMICRVLDRVLRAGHYWVPHWTKASHFMAFYDLYDRPSVKPKFGRGVPDTWWMR
jgi:microcin C transport system substrate-binding protein